MSPLFVQNGLFYLIVSDGMSHEHVPEVPVSMSCHDGVAMCPSSEDLLDCEVDIVPVSLRVYFKYFIGIF